MPSPTTCRLHHATATAHCLPSPRAALHYIRSPPTARLPFYTRRAVAGLFPTPAALYHYGSLPAPLTAITDVCTVSLLVRNAATATPLLDSRNTRRQRAATRWRTVLPAAHCRLQHARLPTCHERAAAGGHRLPFRLALRTHTRHRVDVAALPRTALRAFFCRPRLACWRSRGSSPAFVLIISVFVNLEPGGRMGSGSVYSYCGRAHLPSPVPSFSLLPKSLHAARSCARLRITGRHWPAAPTLPATLLHCLARSTTILHASRGVEPAPLDSNRRAFCLPGRWLV